MLTNNEISELKLLLNQKKKIVITSHTNPDGDAIGSSLAMYHYLTKLGNTVNIVLPNKFPNYYNWLTDSDKILIYEKQSKLSQKLLVEAEIIFSLDYNAISRLGALTEIVLGTSAKRILIDHHIDPEIENFDYCHSTVETSSTGELIYDFITKAGDEKLIDKNIAEAIYTGIVTDTGSFSFSCNRPETYLITSKLISHGVNAEKIHKLIYDTYSENRLRLLGYAISNRMVVWEELHTALIYLTKSDLKKYNYKVGDTEGVVNYPLSMEKINMSVLITERDNKLRLSFRSKGDFSVNELAKAHFNGGGHKNAAGGKTSETIDELIDRLKTVMGDYKKQLNYIISL
ncbi:MAG: bifunctional oligoribonuclease/PAP phosphatase NrnA [Bacteroidetes bacterium]|nr:bifunctional oligoribonuclease/PAP phosphatase NrnA [Bacteroidota bacterium]